MRKLIIYGASFVDTVRLVNEINAYEPSWEIVGFIDNRPELVNTKICHYPVLGNYEFLKAYIAQFPDTCIFNNVNPSIAVHKRIGERIDTLQAQVISLVHPDINTEFTTIGKGVFIPKGCTLGCNSIIGDYVTFRYGVIVSHDVKVGNYAFLGPGSVCTSHTVIEPETYVGACATVINGAIIGKGSFVGASTLINKNVRPGATVVGIPAREISK